MNFCIRKTDMWYFISALKIIVSVSIIDNIIIITNNAIPVITDNCYYLENVMNGTPK